MYKIVCCFLLISHLVHSAQVPTEAINSKLVIKNAERAIDLTTQVVKISNKITIENSDSKPIKSFVFLTEHKENAQLAYLTAQTAGSVKTTLKHTEVKLDGHPQQTAWKIDLKDALSSDKSTSVHIEEFWINALHPYPQAISQKEKQLMKYFGNSQLLSPYEVKKVTTSVTVRTRNVESYTKTKPVTLSDGIITYGPYSDIAPFASSPIEVHYENSSPFLTVKNLERVIEVSHWGNIAIEETIHLVHTGAALKGPFSRYDYQRESSAGQPSVKSFKMMLPASAVDIYYRDDIGNISTSHTRVLKDAVELELRPRFPLFGGWQTRYIVGYNVPSYEYLYNSGENFILKMRLIDHIFDDMIVERITTKIILPEMSNSVKLETPYNVARLEDDLHFTYLDTHGRPTITMEKTNLIEAHIQDFTLGYKFSPVVLLHEPIVAVIALYLLFLLVIIIVRLDFSIVKDDVLDSKMRVAGHCENILQHHNKRFIMYQDMDNQLNKLKTNKDVNAFTSEMKSIANKQKNETTAITDLAIKLKPTSLDTYEKCMELQKFDRALKELYITRQSLYLEKLIPNKIIRNVFVESEKAFTNKKTEIIEKQSNICKSLQ